VQTLLAMMSIVMMLWLEIMVTEVNKSTGCFQETQALRALTFRAYKRM